MEIRTKSAGRRWALVDLTDELGRWTAQHEYAEAFYEDPSDFTSSIVDMFAEDSLCGGAAQLAEHAMEKGATTLLLPVSARRQLLDVSDAVATRISFHFYSDAKDALLKVLDE